MNKWLYTHTHTHTHTHGWGGVGAEKMSLIFKSQCLPAMSPPPPPALQYLPEGHLIPLWVHGGQQVDAGVLDQPDHALVPPPVLSTQVLHEAPAAAPAPAPRCHASPPRSETPARLQGAPNRSGLETHPCSFTMLEINWLLHFEFPSDTKRDFDYSISPISAGKKLKRNDKECMT